MGLDLHLHSNKAANNADNTGYGQNTYDNSNGTTNPNVEYEGTGMAGSRMNPDNYNDTNGTNPATGQHEGRFKNTAEGAAVGGVAGHEWQKHHGGTHGAGAGTALGAAGGNEYNRHHNGGPAVTNNAADYNNTNGTNPATGQHEGRFKNTAEGAAVGGVAGHEWQKHHGGTHGAGAGTALGAAGGNEYNRHHHGGPAVSNNAAGYDNATGATGAGAAAGTGLGANTSGTGTAGGPYSAGAAQPSSVPNDAEARHLNRSGKIEKAIGNVLCSTTMQQKGLQKQAQAANIQAQHQNLTEAQNLEAQAKFRRAQAVGLGADPAHGNPATAPGQTTNQQGAGFNSNAGVGPGTY